MWQYVAVCGSTWQYVAVVAICGSMWQYVVICGIMRQYVAVCGSTWQYVAVRGSTWQYVAVRYDPYLHGISFIGQNQEKCTQFGPSQRQSFYAPEFSSLAKNIGFPAVFTN